MILDKFLNLEGTSIQGYRHLENIGIVFRIESKNKKATAEAQKNKKQKGEKEAKLEVLKRSKYSLLKNEEDLTEPQKLKLEAIKENFPNLKEMQELKEEFRRIYETSKNPTEGKLSISEWLAKSSIVFTKSCQTIRNCFGEIISYFERRTTNGVVEGINNKLKLIKRRGYGFRNGIFGLEVCYLGILSVDLA